MTVFNLGSINADLVYRVPHLPEPGETLASTSFTRFLGGKGANMSVAAARAAARVVHIGAVGHGGDWMVDRLTEYGVDTREIVTVSGESGHAVIAVDDHGENSILLFHGANTCLDPEEISGALAQATAEDSFLFQNETNAQREAAEAASLRGMRIVYAAAPFDADAVQDVMPLIDMLVLNEVEAAQLEEATGLSPENLPVKDIVVTLGSKGCRWYETDKGEQIDVPAIQVDPVDTTGAGDTFTGYLVAGLDRGFSMRQSLDLATKAAAIMVTRQGTADVIPDLKDIEDARFNRL